MTNKYTIVLVLTVIVATFSISVVPVYAETGNKVYVDFSYQNNNGTDGDNLENIPVVWSHGWFTNIINTPDDSGSPVINPKVELKTSTNLVKFYPDDPSIFTAQPDLGIYTWNFNGLNLLELFHLPLYAKTSDDTRIAKPRFSASRSVVPETLTDEITEQVVTLTLKFEDPLPPEINNVHIAMGASKIAYEQYSLVEGQFVSMEPVANWNSDIDGVQARWFTNPSNIEIGKTYIFQAILRSVKSSDLKGSPIFKPAIGIDYNRVINKPMVNSNSITITDPDNIISASFIADNVVDWYPNYQDNWFHYSFQPIVSQITLPPPPFHVLVPANVQIEPDTLNLKSNGEWITAYIEFPEVYDVNNIVVPTVLLKTPSGDVPVDPNSPATVGDYDSDGISDLMVKFDRSIVVGQLSSINVDDGTGINQQFELKVVGQLVDETQFEGTDTIRVIGKGK